MLLFDCIDYIALAAAQASDSVLYLKQFKSILQTLLFFYQNNAVFMKESMCNPGCTK